MASLDVAVAPAGRGKPDLGLRPARTDGLGSNSSIREEWELPALLGQAGGQGRQGDGAFCVVASIDALTCVLGRRRSSQSSQRQQARYSDDPQTIQARFQRSSRSQQLPARLARGAGAEGRRALPGVLIVYAGNIHVFFLFRIRPAPPGGCWDGGARGAVDQATQAAFSGSQGWAG